MFKKILLTLITGLLLIPVLAKADGGIMPPPDFWVYETGQKAAIVYQDKIETLVLSTSFAGDAKDFAYIVPTPSQPEVSKVSDDIFANLEELTYQPLPTFGSAEGLGGGAEMAVENKVTVLEEKKVGIFDVKILSATDVNALFDWLKENNFTYPANKKYILDDYIQNKWFFTTAKISAEAISQDVKSKLQTGELAPLKLVFQADNMVFPLKISAVTDKEAVSKEYEALTLEADNASVSADSEIIDKMIAYPPDSVPISLYIFSDHKVEHSQFYPVYANWVKKAEIEKLAKDDNGNHWVNISGKKIFLTYLSGTILYSDMTNDLFFDNAKNNDKVGVESWWENVLTFLGTIGLALIFLVLLVLFFILCIWQFKPCSRRCRIVCWVLQGVGFVVVALPMLLIFGSLMLSNMMYSESYTDIYSLAVIIGLSLLFLGIPVFMIILMILEGVKQRRMKEGE